MKTNIKVSVPNLKSNKYFTFFLFWKHFNSSSQIEEMWPFISITLRSEKIQKWWSYDSPFSHKIGPTFQNRNIIILPVGDLGKCFRQQNSQFWHMSPLFHFRYASGQTHSGNTDFQIKVPCRITKEFDVKFP